MKTIEEVLAAFETTSLYLHTAGKRTVTSPLDRVVIPFPKSA